MAQSSRLAELYIEFTTRGFQEAQEQIKTIKDGMTSAARNVNEVTRGKDNANRGNKEAENSLKRQEQGWRGLLRSIENTTKALTTGLVGGIMAPLGGLIGLAAAASQGTVEGENLGRAWGILRRVLADELGPWVRMLTQGLLEMATGWRSLDQTTRSNIATWVAVGAGILAIVAIMPVLVAAGTAGAAVFSAMWAAITAPVVAIPILIAGVAAGFAALWGYLTGDSKEVWENLSDGSKSWFDKLLDGIAFVITQFAKFFNWVQAQWRKVTNAMGDLIDTFASKFELTDVQKAFFEGMRDGAKMVGDTPLINIDKLKDDLSKAKEWTKNAFTLKNWFPGLDDALNRIKKAGKAGGPGMTSKVNVEYESGQGMFDRLQKAVMGTSTIQEKLLDEAKELNVKTDKQTEEIKKVAGLLPAFR